MFQAENNPIEKQFWEMILFDISYNNIRSLNQNVFQFTPNLNKVFLNRNPLMTIDRGTMSAIASLAKLSVSYYYNWNMN